MHSGGTITHDFRTKYRNGEMTSTLSPVFPNFKQKVAGISPLCVCLFNRVVVGGSGIVRRTRSFDCGFDPHFLPPQSNTHTHRANIRRLLHTHTPGGEKNTTDTERHFESRRDEREFYRETIPKIIKEKRRGRKSFCLVLRHYRDIEPCRMVWVNTNRNHRETEERERETFKWEHNFCRRKRPGLLFFF